MPEYMINGIPVNFPYEPYSIQTTYMEKVIECLKQGVNGMLESPTGTGKTLCLLCASLSWVTLKKAQIQASRGEHLQATCDILLKGLQNEPGTSSLTWSSAPKIIYASRTHSQLTQAIQELKKSGYSHIKVTVLGSRDQLCIHPQVSQSTDNLVKINKCQLLTKSKNCFFHYNLEKKIASNLDFVNNVIMDIEDLVKVGQREKVCPYFLARELKVDADITFIPYNYILDRRRLRTQGLSLEGSVIILDEAHNIEKICEESASMKISSTDIALCIAEITQVMEHILKNHEMGFVDSEDALFDVPPEHLCLLKTVFLELEKAVDDIELKSEGLTLSGSYIVELLAKAKISEENYIMLLGMLESVVQFLSVTGSSPLQSKGAALYKIIELLDVVYKTSVDFSLHLKRLQKSFKVHITHEEIGSSKPSDSWNSTKSTAVSITKGKVINFMCFTPSYGLKELSKLGVRCVIFTSGTLSPLPALISELDIPISVTLENPHVIEPGQVSVSIIKNGPDGHELNSSYKTRNDPKYISSLGNTIVNVCRIVPHGLLVFFPSYPVMYKCKDDWQESGIWSNICKLKPIFVEPKSRDSFSEVMKEYYDAIQNPQTRGACFMAVTRGKVSEGLDFMDVNGRAVVVTGLPYPPMMDAYVKLKKEYLRESCKDKASYSLTPDQWYLYEATRAVNQAIGRVIRHKNDYGAIILCDYRFGQYSIKKALSSWIQSQIKIYETFGPVIRDLKNFFVNAEQTLPAPRVSGPTVEVKLPTAVGASFDEVTSRASKSETSDEITLKDILLASDLILEEYTSSIRKRKTSPEPKKKKIDIFDALEKPTDVIDFNDMTAASTSRSLFSWNKTDEPVMKTKKLKVAPPKIMPLSQESEDVFSGECSSGAASNKPSTSTADLTRCSKQAEASGKSNITHMSSSENSRKYLYQVRSLLDHCSYYRFKAICFEYEKTKDLKNLLTGLQDTLMQKGRNFPTLFRDFRCFVFARHKEEFDEYLKKIPDY